jgi:hypothetical protein
MDAMCRPHLLSEESYVVVRKNGSIQGVLAFPWAQGSMCTIVQNVSLPGQCDFKGGSSRTNDRCIQLPAGRELDCH